MPTPIHRVGRTRLGAAYRSRLGVLTRPSNHFLVIMFLEAVLRFGDGEWEDALDGWYSLRDEHGPFTYNMVVLDSPLPPVKPPATPPTFEQYGYSYAEIRNGIGEWQAWIWADYVFGPVGADGIPPDPLDDGGGYEKLRGLTVTPWPGGGGGGGQEEPNSDLVDDVDYLGAPDGVSVFDVSITVLLEEVVSAFETVTAGKPRPSRVLLMGAPSDISVSFRQWLHEESPITEMLSGGIGDNNWLLALTAAVRNLAEE